MGRWLTGLATIALGVVLMVMAVPRLVAHLLLLPGNVAVSRVLAGEILTEQGYDRIFRSREAALRWHELPEARIELGGTLYYLLQAAGEYEFDTEAALMRARQQLERGLAQAPVDTHAWLWLADIRLRLNEPEGAVEALRLSQLSSPFEPALGPLRAVVALRLWDRLPEGVRQAAARDAVRALTSTHASEFLRDGRAFAGGRPAT
jgi:hypothetical protein